MIAVDPQRDLADDPAAVHARRVPVTSAVRFADRAGSVDTSEGTVQHGAGAAILTGVRGERWPVERARFEATYEPVPPTRMGENGAYRRQPSRVLARQYDQPFEVALSGGRGILRGRGGDWLVQYAPGDLAVVSNDVFAQTYVTE